MPPFPTLRVSRRKTLSEPRHRMATSAPPSSALTSASTTLASELDLPSDKTLLHAARIAIEQDKPIMLDYYLDTKEGRAFLGEDATTKEKMLVRSEEEYTSLIQKIFKVKDDFIVITENSLYIVSGSIKKKSITTPTN
jgi:DNA-binding GntR family transcriptional regulator